MSCTEAIKSGNQVRISAQYKNLINTNEIIVPTTSYVSIMDSEGKVINGYPTTMLLSGSTFIHDFDTTNKKGEFIIAVYSGGNYIIRDSTRVVVI